MIGIRTPFRMSFMGGGSDLKEFYRRSFGSVLSTTINKYMYIFIHPFFDNRIQLKYSKTELVNQIDEIRHPIAREVLRKFSLESIDINSIADIPAGSGLGSSSSYTVGLLHALYKYTDKDFTKALLAENACEIEIDILKEPIGKQDQYAASFGGLNVIEFHSDNQVVVKPIKISSSIKSQLEENLILFYTGRTRKASSVLNDQKKNILNEESKYDSLIKMVELVKNAESSLIQSNLDDFGHIMHANWKLKKSLSNKISGSEIDDLYELAQKNGALGGKILGAGGGGFMLFYCPKLKQSKLRKALKGLKEFKFKFDNDGSKVIFSEI